MTSEAVDVKRAQLLLLGKKKVFFKWRNCHHGGCWARGRKRRRALPALHGIVILGPVAGSVDVLSTGAGCAAEAAGDLGGFSTSEALLSRGGLVLSFAALAGLASTIGGSSVVAWPAEAFCLGLSWPGGKGDAIVLARGTLDVEFDAHHCGENVGGVD